MSYYKLHQDWYADKTNVDGGLQQWFLMFQYKEMYFVIYLRWRYSDPWQATIIETSEDFDIHADGAWTEINRLNYELDQLEELKVDVLKIAIQAVVELEKKYESGEPLKKATQPKPKKHSEKDIENFPF